MDYVITNGKSYIAIGKASQFFKVEDIKAAHIFNDSQKCKNILNNQLRMEKHLWHYEKVNLNRMGTGQMKVYPGRPVEKTSTDDNFDSIKEIVSELDGKYIQLKSELDMVSKEITDIYHAIEFYDLDTPKGYQVYKMLQERLRKRRNIKDEIYKIEVIRDSKIGKKSIGKAESKLNHMEQRSYVPRVLQELFDIVGAS